MMSGIARNRYQVRALTALAALLIAIFVFSYFIDPIVRARVEITMNRELHAYHTQLARAHLQLLGGSLTLKGLTISQNAHPEPPVAKIEQLQLQIQWHELLFGHVVANVLLQHPALHINLTQLREQRAGKVSLRQVGWQEALQKIYPFKINRLEIPDGEVVYEDTDPTHPLHLKKLRFVADNIRNFHPPDATYPSTIHAEAIIFETGKATVDGNANFLSEPFPGTRLRYRIENVPLRPFEPELKRANFTIDAGTIDSRGSMEYSPAIERVEVQEARLDRVNLSYIHTSETESSEKARAQAVKEQAQKATNQPGLVLKMEQLDFNGGNLKFVNAAKDPVYSLYLSSLNVRMKGLSNHFSQAPAGVEMTGLFMGSGQTSIHGSFRPEQVGPNLNLDIAIENTSLSALNDLLRAYGRFDVRSGTLSVYSQLTVKQGTMTGYVKPLFGNIEVYDSQKDSGKPVFHQAYELAIGGAVHLLKNHSSKEVATEIPISGQLSNPNTDTWDGIVELLENAFIQAILPGFDHATQNHG
jgi:hypothetical protein